jgi:GNAT superfamily N-acetyltransferase
MDDDPLGVATTSQRRPEFEVRELLPEQERDAAVVLTDAFIDDPGWRSVGPDNRRLRRAVERRYHRAALRIARRWGGPVFCALHDGQVVGVAVTFAPGRYPPPGRSFAYEVPPFLLAGPAPSVRGLRVQSLMEREHLRGPHSYLWQLAAAPPWQRQGVGRRLIGRVAEGAERDGVPVFLETATPENVPYYASNGFEVVSEHPLPRGARMWFMVRPGGGGG